MIKGPKLSQDQWKLLSGAFSNIGQAIILFSLAALFVPEAVGLSKNFSRFLAVGFLMFGLTTLYTAVIMSKRGK